MREREKEKKKSKKEGGGEVIDISFNFVIQGKWKQA